MEASPAALIVNSALWDLLYGEGYRGYAKGLKQLLGLVDSSLATLFQRTEGTPSLKVAWLLTTWIATDVMVEWKRPYLRNDLVDRVNQLTLSELVSASVCRAGSCVVIDSHSLTKANPSLSVDGIHYRSDVSLAQLELIWHLFVV